MNPQKLPVLSCIRQQTRLNIKICRRAKFYQITFTTMLSVRLGDQMLLRIAGSSSVPPFMPHLRDQPCAELGNELKNRCNVLLRQNCAKIPCNRGIFQGAEPLSSKGRFRLRLESEAKPVQFECAHPYGVEPTFHLHS